MEGEEMLYVESGHVHQQDSMNWACNFVMKIVQYPYYKTQPGDATQISPPQKGEGGEQTYQTTRKSAEFAKFPHTESKDIPRLTIRLLA